MIKKTPLPFGDAAFFCFERLSRPAAEFGRFFSAMICRQLPKPRW
jgi:hypothetical protein